MPQKIYNIDETDVSTEHNPPKFVCDRSIKPKNIASARSLTVRITVSGNAKGKSIPPYNSFRGQRWNEEFLKGANIVLWVKCRKRAGHTHLCFIIK